MVDVVKRVKHEVECDQCFSDLVYYFNDVVYDCTKDDHSIVCPECKLRILVPDPEWWDKESGTYKDPNER